VKETLERKPLRINEDVPSKLGESHVLYIIRVAKTLNV